MASAMAKVAAVNGTAEGDLQLILDVVYVGSEITSMATTGSVIVTFPGDAQPAAIRAAMAQGVAVEAANQGFAVAGANMSLPTFQKG